MLSESESKLMLQQTCYATFLYSVPKLQTGYIRSAVHAASVANISPISTQSATGAYEDLTEQHRRVSCSCSLNTICTFLLLCLSVLDSICKFRNVPTLWPANGECFWVLTWAVNAVWHSMLFYIIFC